ncbi:MAG TPA: hypothetical protein VGI22_09105 [Xanthobacteraceae bacterium]|jgi:pyruvate,orthophosphate dikinase
MVTTSGLEVSTHRAQLAGSTIAEGDWLSVDGQGGSIYLGRQELVCERPEADLAEVASWRALATQRKPATALS